MIRNLNPKRILDIIESPSTKRNPSLIRIQDVVRNPNPTSIQDVTRNPYPTRIEYPLSYNGITITLAYAKKMKEALHMLISMWS